MALPIIELLLLWKCRCLLRTSLVVGAVVLPAELGADDGL